MHAPYRMTPYLSRELLATRVRELAEEIDGHYAGETIVAISVLQGSFVFYSDLVREMRTPLRCEFLAPVSYGKATPQSGEVKIILDIESPLENEHLLLVEDLVDTGHTLNFLRRALEARKPRSLKVCTLFARRPQQSLDYVGFKLDKQYVAGYGIDHEGKHRELPEIHVLELISKPVP